MSDFAKEMEKAAAGRLVEWLIGTIMSVTGAIFFAIWNKRFRKFNFGTRGFDQISYSDVTDSQWLKIAKKGMDEDGLVAKSLSMRSVYEGRKLVEYYVDIEYINLSSNPCQEIVFSLWPLLGSKERLPQKVEFLSSDVELTDTKIHYSSPGYADVEEYTYRFKSGGIKPNSDGRNLSLKITPIYKNEKQALLVTPDMCIGAQFKAIRKLVTAVNFSNDCLPINIRCWIIEVGHRYDPLKSKKMPVELKGRECRVEYYGVQKQGFKYGIIWDWPNVVETRK